MPSTAPWSRTYESARNPDEPAVSAWPLKNDFSASVSIVPVSIESELPDSAEATPISATRPLFDAASVNANQFPTGYNGVVSFTKTLAREVARHQVTVNAVCPGPTETPMLEQMVAAGDDSARVIDAMRRAVPVSRRARAGHVHDFTCLWGALGCACWAV